MNGLALCAGIGGIELGLHLAIGERSGHGYRTVGYIEREAFAASACRVAYGASGALEHRIDRLRCLGNGVVPLAAAYAFRALCAAAGIRVWDGG